MGELKHFLDATDSAERKVAAERRLEARASKEAKEAEEQREVRHTFSSSRVLTVIVRYEFVQNSIFTTSCDSRHKAVSNAFKTQAKHIDITGVSFTVCRHGCLFRAATMWGGERCVSGNARPSNTHGFLFRFGYAVYQLLTLLEDGCQTRFFSCDVNCKLLSYLK
jgi:hypothetical protein